MARTGRFLLNTNIVIALFAEEAAVQQRLAEANEVFVPSIVLGELYYGARKSVRVAGTDKTFVLYCSGRRVPCYEVRGD
jgi:predicted nucleic acid-binding protein